MLSRARREAQLLGVPLFWIQAAGDISGLGTLSKEERAKVMKLLLRHWNVHDAGHLRTLLPAYVGERVRLLRPSAAKWR